MLRWPTYRESLHVGSKGAPRTKQHRQHWDAAGNMAESSREGNLGSVRRMSDSFDEQKVLRNQQRLCSNISKNNLG